jgi:hypothetical protein
MIKRGWDKEWKKIFIETAFFKNIFLKIKYPSKFYLKQGFFTG